MQVTRLTEHSLNSWQVHWKGKEAEEAIQQKVRKFEKVQSAWLNDKGYNKRKTRDSLSDDSRRSGFIPDLEEDVQSPLLREQVANETSSSLPSISCHSLLKWFILKKTLGHTQDSLRKEEDRDEAAKKCACVSKVAIIADSSSVETSLSLSQQ